MREAVIDALSSRALGKVLKRNAKQGDEQAKASRDLAAAEERLEEIAADYAAGTISRREWMAAREKASDRIAKASRVLDRHQGILADLPREEPALRAKWETGSIEQKRAMILAVLDHVEILKGKPTPRFDDKRIKFHWRT